MLRFGIRASAVVQLQRGRGNRISRDRRSHRVALLFIAAVSIFREPNRRNFMAVMIAGAGAAYLNGGLGKWEFLFTAVVTYCAYKGLSSYKMIGVGWMLHSGWDVLHHLYGTPIIPFLPLSSFGCAICDPVIALWCFFDAPSFPWPQRLKRESGLN